MGTEISGYIPSIGAFGTHPRSDERVVTTLPDYITSPRDLRGAVHATSAAMRLHGATRAQMKFFGSPELAASAPLRPFVEAYLDMSNGVQNGVIYTAHNRETRSGPSVQDEWDIVREKWKQPLKIPPVDRVRQVLERGYTLTNSFNEADIPRIARLWNVFGWSEDGTEQWLRDYREGVGGWACGYRNSQGHIEAMAKAEELGGIIESTEWAVLKTNEEDDRRKGLGTAVVTSLNAQILRDMKVSDQHHGWTVFAEANMDPMSPGNLVARNAGFVACANLDSITPNGVLRHHVSVDGVRRNFLLTQLTQKGIHDYYPDDVVDYINSQSVS